MPEIPNFCLVSSPGSGQSSFSCWGQCMPGAGCMSLYVLMYYGRGADVRDSNGLIQGLIGDAGWGLLLTRVPDSGLPCSIQRGKSLATYCTVRHQA